MAHIHTSTHAPPLAPPRSSGAPDAEFDALAELFLGDAPRSAPAPVAPSPVPADRPSAAPIPPQREVRSETGPPIDLVVLGHLPVRSGPWIARYAMDRAARLREPVALIRLSHAHVTVDVVSPASAPAGKADRAPTLGRAISDSVRDARECIIAVDAVEELGLASRPGISSLTVLTSANEAAVVEAYRAIKAVESHLSTRDDEGDPVAIRVGVMGADAERAEQVRRKLSDATRAFVGRDVVLAAAAERIEPTPAANLWRGDTTIEPGQLLDQILSARSAPPSPRVDPPAPKPIVAPAQSPTPGPKPAPSPARMPAADPPVSTDSSIPGLTPVSIPCAPCPLVRFARDANHRLHLIRDDSDSPEKALGALVAVEAWISANRALIELASCAAMQGEPVLNLITRNPAALRHILGSRIRVHAIAPANGPTAIIALN